MSPPTASSSASSSCPRLPSTHPRRASTSSSARRSSSSRTFAVLTCLALASTVAHATPIRPIPEALLAIQSYQATVGRSASATYVPEPQQQEQQQQDEGDFYEAMSTSIMDEVEEELRREMARDPMAGMPKPDSVSGSPSSGDTVTNANASVKPLSRSRRRRRAHP